MCIKWRKKIQKKRQQLACAIIFEHLMQHVLKRSSFVCCVRVWHVPLLYLFSRTFSSVCFARSIRVSSFLFCFHFCFHFFSSLHCSTIFNAYLYIYMECAFCQCVQCTCIHNVICYHNGLFNASITSLMHWSILRRKEAKQKNRITNEKEMQCMKRRSFLPPSVNSQPLSHLHFSYITKDFLIACSIFAASL